ncbi:MAG: hypothetical protein JSR73_13490 [Proteobacteria bacterium]|nr:hypothetical protein [Pseudomonadota bacterium]
MRILASLMLLAMLTLGGCSQEPPPPRKPAPTVFDPLVDQKTRVPAAVETATAQHEEDTRRALDAAEGGQTDGPRR